MTFWVPRSASAADPVLGAALDGFLVCVCATLAEGGRAVCGAECGCEACCLVPGNSPPPADKCDCACGDGQGQVWVRWVESRPRKTSSSKGGGGRCMPLLTDEVIEAGVYRCVSVPDADGVTSCEERGRDAAGLLADRRLLRSALACCGTFRRIPVELLALEPMEARGGCAGVRLEFAVSLA